ncbi:MAG: LysM peptidoglycan-binding domain-containing protein [Spirosomaceae bacterium]|nr:LysM peptidoglycan-binding domain-containing protein [Spirosomataceae bacterium]
MKLRAGYFLLIVGMLHATGVVGQSDSTRTTAKSGEYISHRVEAGQTLYAVMRKYNTTLKALKAANPGMKDNLTVGQIVRVPATSPASAPPKVAAKTPEPTKKEEPAPKTAEQEKIVVDLTLKEKPKVNTEKPKAEEAKTPESVAVKEPEKPAEKAPEKTEPKPVTTAKNGIHVVEGGQSLYGIAVKYGVLMADIRRWNNLSADQLRAGQELIVSDQAYQAALRKNKTDSVRLTDTSKKTPTEKLPPPPREDMTNANLPEPKIANTGKRILETGVAEVIDGMDSNNKYLALHRTAPVGSLIQVKNMNNSASVWVKVIGKLPDISANNRIIIKLSARAQEKLSPGGRQFIAEISYLAQ